MIVVNSIFRHTLYSIDGLLNPSVSLLSWVKAHFSFFLVSQNLFIFLLNQTTIKYHRNEI